MSYITNRLFVFALLAALLLTIPVRPAIADTYTVTNSNEAGAGSLRDAITQANAHPGADTISFNLGAATTWTINLVTTNLPILTDSSTTIDGPLDGAGHPRVAINGSSLVGNGGYGQGFIIKSSGNIIRGLAIYGFNGFGSGDGTYGVGVVIVGPGATGNTVQSCFIGTNLAGTAAGAATNNNPGGGVLIVNGAGQNVVTGNVISGNTVSQYALFIGSLGSSNTAPNRNNVVSNNKIGVDVNGTAALPNTGAGVYIGNDAFDNTIGPDNIIAGNGQNRGSQNVIDYGVFIAGNASSGGLITGNKVQGNRIGVGANGALIPNQAGGVRADFSQNTVIGGANAADSANGDRGNIIAGNNVQNILVTQTSVNRTQLTYNLQINNNFIGLTSANSTGGTANYGIEIENLVAGITVRGNVISGHASAGVNIDGQSGKPTNITLDSNTIGPNIAGTAGLAARQPTGVEIGSGITNVTLSSNLITGNRNIGVRLRGVNGITLSGNGIGTLRQGNAAIGNGITGVSIIGGSTGNTVGPNNTIAGHLAGTQGDGIYIGENSSGNTIKGNTLSANLRAISLDDGANGNVIGFGGTSIGATGASDGNRVTGNNVGISANGSAALRNRISRTTTSNNVTSGTHYGISISGGANAGIQPPVATGVTLSGGALVGTINTGSADCGGAGCTIEVFQNTQPEPNEGKFFLTSFTKNTNGSASFSAPGVANCMPNLTFTVTDQSGNTSAFSPVVSGVNCTVTTEPTGSATPDLFNQTPPSRTLGPEITTGPVDVAFTATLKNTGDAAGTFDLAVEAPAGWTNAVATPASQQLNPGATSNVSFGVRVPQNTPAGSYTVRLTARLSGNGPADSVDVTVVVPLAAALSLDAASPDIKDGVINLPTCFTHRLTNLGNGNDTFVITVSAPTTPSSWAVSVTPGTQVALARGVASDVSVCVTAPSGTPGGNYLVTVVARSQTNPAVVSATRTDTVHIQDAAAPQLSAAAGQSADPGATVTFAHRLTNVGNIGATFTISALNVPSGWLITGLPITTASIAPNGFVDFTYTVKVADAALAGPFTIQLQATANQAVAASTTADDVVTVNKIAKLALTPATQTSIEPPNSVVTYTLTLTNNGNFADTVGLVVTNISQAARGWTASVTPAPNVLLQPGESKQVALVVRIPPGQPVSVSNVTTVNATSSLPAVNVAATATTNIKPVAAGLFRPLNPIKGALAGETISFDFTLLNSGSLDQTFTTAIASTNGTTATTILTVTSPIALAPGASTPARLTVAVPPDVPDGYEVKILIRSTLSPGNPTPPIAAVAETLATVRVGPPYDVIVDPDRAGTALPGAAVEYTHVVTNTGRFEDSYALSTVSSLGWRSSVAPARVRLLPGESAPVVVTVFVPTSAESNAIDTTALTARSVADSTVSEQATAATRVLQIAGADLSPSLSARLTLGKTIAFQHTLLNSGNGRDSYVITATQTLNWRVQIDYTAPPTKHGRGISLPVQVIVTIPADAPANALDQITIRATSKFDSTVYSEVVDTIAPIMTQSTPSTPGQRVYLPLIAR